MNGTGTQLVGVEEMYVHNFRGTGQITPAELVALPLRNLFAAQIRYPKRYPKNQQGA